MNTKHLSILATLLLATVFGLRLPTVGQEAPEPVVYVTNSLSVVLTEENDNALRIAWKLENNARTNGLPPFSAATNALTYKQFAEQIGRGAFEAIAIQAKQQNEAFFLQRFRMAGDSVQARIARILANKE